MNQWKLHIPFLVSALLLCVAAWVAYPYYQYYVDPDATAYLTIIRRYVAGDYITAVNGYWSPWSCWLAAGLIKIYPLSFMSAAVVVNVAGGIGFLFITHSFLRFFNIQRTLLWLIGLMLVVFLTYAVYAQLCDDLWQCFFLLCILRIMLSEGFKHSVWLWVTIGAIGALAYFAKAYAFPFFLLNTICCTFFVTGASQKKNRSLWVKICATSIAVMIACSFPWIWALHQKYGEWMTGTAGKLNLSWYVVGHPYFKEGILHLVPPVYPDSPHYWEDPYLVNGPAPTAFSDLSLLKLQLVRIPYNLLKMVSSMNQLSALFIPVVLLIISIVFSKKVRSYFPPGIFILGISFLLFPLAFIFINFEARYLWYMLPGSLVVMAIALQHGRAGFYKGKALKVAAVVIFLVSYLYWPLMEMQKMYKVGSEDYRLAVWLKQEGIKGSFTSNAYPGLEQQGIGRVAYFSGNPYYFIPFQDIDHGTLLREMRRYKVKYYFYFYGPSEGDTYAFRDETGIALPEILNDKACGIKVFQLNP